MKMLIGEGAEAKVFFENNVVIKDRMPKSYRIKELDETLIFSRTRKETNILKKIESLNISPKILPTKQKNLINMSLIEGVKLRDHMSKENYPLIAKEIGEKIAVLHGKNIIHGDLTTSNMIFNLDSGVNFVDFGLGYVSQRFEDKAVDLHLLKQALESYHHEIWEDCFGIVMKEYSKNSPKEVIDRFKVVDKRGKNKH